MKTNRSVIKFRRKREGKTNYKKRLELLKAKQTRLVVRKSLKNINAQLISYEKEGDKIIASANSHELNKLGWNFSGKSIPCAYLIGLLIGKKAKENKIKNVVLDIGMQRSIPKSKLYAAVKGVMDSGVDVPCSEEVMPSEERIKGEHIAAYAKDSKSTAQFSKQNKDDIAKLPAKFEEIKNKIMG